jgi:tetratricopeptide (TPR) repeat protein
MARGRRAALLLVLATGLGSALPGPAYADFSARGRNKPKPGAAKPGASKPAPRPRDGAPQPAAPAARPERGEGTQDREALIARYTGLVLSRPAEPFPLQRLAELYRERDGDLEKLIADFEARAAKAGADQYNATVALAGIYKHDARTDLAIRTYERAIAERSTEADAMLALANLFYDRGEKARAKEWFERALPNVKTDAAREPIVRSLMSLSLDLGDFDAAKKYHEQIIAKAGGSFFTRAELGRELLVRSEYERAEKEFRALTQTVAGDNRALAPALRDLGRALAGQKKRQEALSALERALSAAGQQSGLRKEIFDIIVEVYRADNNVAELIVLLVKENPNDFERLAMLGAL